MDERQNLALGGIANAIHYVMAISYIKRIIKTKEVQTEDKFLLVFICFHLGEKLAEDFVLPFH